VEGAMELAAQARAIEMLSSWVAMFSTIRDQITIQKTESYQKIFGSNSQIEGRVF